MKAQRPIIADDDHRVLQFRPRAAAALSPDQHAAPRRQGTTAPTTPAADSAQHQPSVHQPDEFRHRMLANLAALAFTLALTGIGIWLAISLADMRKTQDCVLMGRRDCAQIGAPQG
ncbi:hypothetical protein HNR60_003888 [Rhodopseudomonas rhenobacensis]|uniref:Uncharacterized protein n=1 Tax=Rhodopseudomonas rhenobacensis TaxID=87461 RepID=A0A7W8E067_9BRAD|nr:hypothetical protein [Rhodopseudomonas rhenobacensis]MBB5049114.1 hypothetical protein [Rhodopseudomonas rhenobacensis]